MQKRFKAVYIQEVSGRAPIPDFPILENRIKEYASVEDPMGDRKVFLNIGVAAEEIVFSVKDCKKEQIVSESRVSLNTKEWDDYVNASLALLRHQKPAAIEQFLTDAFVRADERVFEAGIPEQYEEAAKKLGKSIANQVWSNQRIAMGDTFGEAINHQTFAGLARIALGFHPAIRTSHKISATVLAAQIKADAITPP